MDSISQALWGALSASAVTKKKWTGRLKPWLVGLIGGTMPDLDVVFNSPNDPLFATLMHRSFSHSIFLIPLGALLTWLVLWPLIRKERALYLGYYWMCLASYGTHWFLDWMTSYGTQVFWPLSTYRYSADWLSIIDPILTLPWLIIFFILLRSQSPGVWARWTMGFSGIYMAFCAQQNYQAIKTISQIAKCRGHQIERVRALPSMANSFWFRTIYLHQGNIYADGVLVKPFTKPRFEPGTQAPHVTPRTFANLSAPAQDQIQIWDWFTDSWMYIDNAATGSLGDGRYSLSVTSFASLWSLKVDSENPQNTIRSSPSFEGERRERQLWDGFTRIANPSQLQSIEHFLTDDCVINP